MDDEACGLISTSCHEFIGLLVYWINNGYDFSRNRDTSICSSNFLVEISMPLSFRLYAVKL